jgi:putative ATP-dependent endonuclease of OLD family
VGRLLDLRVRNFRSIGDWVHLEFPERGPLVLIGENNAGKSNIMAALDLVLGEGWPGNFQPEDHECFGRDPAAMPMRIAPRVDGVTHYWRGNSEDVHEITWRFDPDDPDGRPCAFDAWTGTGESFYMSNATREQVFCMVVGADRRLTYQLSYTSKWTYLSRLMHKFHKRLTQDPDRVDRLKEHFANLVTIFYEVEAFSSFSDDLRRTAAELGANFQYALELDFSAYDPSNFFRSLRVQPTTAGDVRTFDELGTGQEQILALAFAYAYAAAFGDQGDGLVLVVEEPEAHLHPLAQEWLSRKVHDLTDRGTQVVLTTHSPAFVDLHHLDGVVRVFKDPETLATQVVQQSSADLARYCRERGATRADSTNVLEFYGASATDEIVSGLFARACCIVEGRTEVLGLPALLRGASWDPVEHGVAVVSAEGIGNIARWWRFYRSYGIPVYVLFDRDSRDDPGGNRRAELLAAIGCSEAQFERGLAAGAPLAMLDGAAVCVNDFEGCMRSLFPNVYAEFEAVAQSELGSSKPLVARFACTRLAELPDEQGWEAVRQLSDSLAGLVSASA